MKQTQRKRFLSLLVALLPLVTCLQVCAQHVSYRSFAHYNKRVVQFEREGGIDSTCIVMLGNSLTENGKDWAGRVGVNIKVVNRGIIGDNTIGMRERLCQITPHHPRAIFLMAGINDMSGGITAAEVAERVINLIDTIRAQAPQTRLFVQSMLPINESNGRWKTLTGRTDDIPFGNMLIKAYCQTQGITYVDIFPKLVRGHTNQLRAELTVDGIHLSEQGYKIWAFELRRYFRELVSEN